MLRAFGPDFWHTPAVERQTHAVPDRQGDLTLSGFVASALVAGLLAGGTYWVSVRETQAQAWIAHTHEVLAGIATTRADLAEIQEAQRGLLTTNESADLQRDEEAQQALLRDVQYLRGLVLDNPAQQANLDSLDEHLAARVRLAARVMQARRDDGAATARHLANDAAERTGTTTVRELLQAMEQEETRLLAQRWEEHQRALGAFWSGMALLLLAFIATLAVLYRQVRRRRHAERQLLRGEQQFHAMADSVSDYAILMLDTEGYVRTWNPAARRMKGYEADEIVGQHFSCFYTAQERALGVPRQALDRAQRDGHFSGEGWRVHKDGSRFWASVAIAPLRGAGGEFTGYAKITRDLSEHKAADERLRADMEERDRMGAELQRLNAQLEAVVEERTLALQERNQALRAARDRLQALSGQLISAQEEERRHIARELHDETGQALTLIRMHLSELGADATGQRQQQFAECVQSVDRSIAHIRSLSLRLRPPMLDDLGLADALEWIVGQQSRATGWRARVTLPELEQRLPGEVETACFRICQEALTNVTRYARATEVSVTLGITAQEALLQIQDNGTGFDLARYRSPEERKKHFGLVSMSERASLAGGRLEIDTAPGRGTCIRATFALSPEARDEPVSAPGELLA